MRRLSPLEGIYTKDRSVEVCLDTLQRLGFSVSRAVDLGIELVDGK
jgi:hypothetical protein